MSTPPVTIIITTWNSLKFLPYCLESIFKQTFKDFSVIIIDNGSNDGTLEFVKEKYPQAATLKNPKNLGFAHANNQGIKMAKSEYILLCNADIILENNFLASALKTIKTDEKIASVSGKLFKAKWDKEELPKPVKTDILDSCGLEIFKSCQVRERGRDEADSGQCNQKEKVFGSSGALALFKKSALEDVKIFDEYFDEDFFSYKEDVDLAWRLKLAGYKSVYNPMARAYHFRRISEKDDRKTRSRLLSRLSYKNHLLMIIKNQTLDNLFIFFPFMFFYEFKKFIYLLIFEQSTLVGLINFFQQLPRALRKRKIIMIKKKADSKEIRRWFK